MNFFILFSIITIVLVGVVVITNKKYKKFANDHPNVLKFIFISITIFYLFSSLSWLQSMTEIPSTLDWNAKEMQVLIDSIPSMITCDLLKIFLGPYLILLIFSCISLFMSFFFIRLTYLIFTNKTTNSIFSINAVIFSIPASLILTSLSMPYFYTDIIATLWGFVASAIALIQIFKFFKKN